MSVELLKQIPDDEFNKRFWNVVKSLTPKTWIITCEIGEKFYFVKLTNIFNTNEYIAFAMDDTTIVFQNKSNFNINFETIKKAHSAMLNSLFNSRYTQVLKNFTDEINL